MEDSIHNALQKLNYTGYLSNKDRFKEIINTSIITPPFIQLVVWLTSQIKEYCQVEDTVSGDVGTFVIDIKGFVRELGFPYGEILQTNGLDTSKGRMFLLDFLVTELQTCRMLNSNPSKSGIIKTSTDTMDIDENTIPQSIEKITKALKLPLSSNITILFTTIENMIKELLSKLPSNYLDDPLLKKSLSASQWDQVSKINDTMSTEYKMRRQVLIKRVDVTIQSFYWSDKVKKSSEQVTELFQPIRGNLTSDSKTTIVDVLAARTDLCVIEKTSSGQVREVSKTDLNKHMIGKVPDRGGRPSLVAPAPEMPKFQQRKPDQPRGGGRGGYRGGGSRGGWRGGRNNANDNRRGGQQSDRGKMYFS